MSVCSCRLLPFVVTAAGHALIAWSIGRIRYSLPGILVRKIPDAITLAAMDPNAVLKVVAHAASPQKIPLILDAKPTRPNLPLLLNPQQKGHSWRSMNFT